MRFILSPCIAWEQNKSSIPGIATKCIYIHKVNTNMLSSRDIAEHKFLCYMLVCSTGIHAGVGIYFERESSWSLTNGKQTTLTQNRICYSSWMKEWLVCHMWSVNIYTNMDNLNGASASAQQNKTERNADVFKFIIESCLGEAAENIYRIHFIDH